MMMDVQMNITETLSIYQVCSLMLVGFYFDFGEVKSKLVLVDFIEKNLSRGHLGNEQQIEIEKKCF